MNMKLYCLRTCIAAFAHKLLVWQQHSLLNKATGRASDVWKKSRTASCITGVFISVCSYADGYYPELTSQDQPWSITASAGAGQYSHVYHSDNDNALGRLALGNEMLLTGDIALGLELGVQNGNHMRIAIPTETLSMLGWLPIQTTLKPMLDLLVTAKSDPLAGSSFFAQFKGGVAYRYWQINHFSFNDLSQLAGEIQAGVGYPLTALTSLNLLYQGVFGSDPNLQINTLAKRGSVSNIPALHGVLLGLSVNL